MQTIYQSFESPFIETFYQPFAIELKNRKPAVYQVLQYAYYLFSILAPIIEMAVIALALKISFVNLSLTALFCVLATSMVLARLVAVLPATIVMRILQSYSQNSECVSFTYILIAQWFGINDWSHDFFTQKKEGHWTHIQVFFFDSIATIALYAVLIAAVAFLHAPYIVQIIICTHPIVEIIRGAFIQIEWKKFLTAQNTNNTQAPSHQNESRSTVRNIAQSLVLITAMLFVISTMGPAALELLFMKKSDKEHALLNVLYIILLACSVSACGFIVRLAIDIKTCICNVPNLFHPKAHIYRTNRYNRTELPKMPEYPGGAYDWLRPTPSPVPEPDPLAIDPIRIIGKFINTLWEASVGKGDPQPPQ